MNSEHEIETALGAISGGRVLDVGTGTGGMIAWMADSLQSFDEITGIDATDLSSREGDDSVFARENIHFQQMDAHHMTFDDASFDTVMISNSLHHMADPRQVLTEMCRVLKPGGHCIVREMFRDDQTEPQLTHVYLHHWWADIDRALGITHNTTFSRQELIDLLESLGVARWDCYDYIDLNADPMDEEGRARMRGHIDRYLDRARDLPDFAAIQARGEELMRRLDDVGLLGATALIAIGEK